MASRCPAIPSAGVALPGVQPNSVVDANASGAVREHPGDHVPPPRPHGDFQSILYERDAERAAAAPREAPPYFRDLNLDQVVTWLTAGKEDYDLAPFFHDRLQSLSEIGYRHEVMRDLRQPAVLVCVRSFAGAMRQMRKQLAQAGELHYERQQQRWFVHAVQTYCTAVRALHEGLAPLALRSRGMRAFRDHVTRYVSSEGFTTLARALAELSDALADVRYCVLFKENGFTVRRYEGEQDYTVDILQTFDKFAQEAAHSYLASFSHWPQMNHVEAKILDFVAQLYPEVFAALARFCTEHRDYADPKLTSFDRQLQFYVCCIERMEALEQAGLEFCYPRMSDDDKNEHVAGVFDLALAARLAGGGAELVRNDFRLHGQERILVISGPNQGGKTTFARAFGQVHHLAAIGCPVPAREARLYLCDALFTHFERAERIADQRGKLMDDLVRIRAILRTATPRSLVVLNEIFNSTSLQDAVLLGARVVEHIAKMDLLCVCVTFLDELASLNEKTVSMVSTVRPDDPAVRTFKIVRRPADGRAYAIAVAEKHGLTHARIRERLAAAATRQGDASPATTRRGERAGS